MTKNIIWSVGAVIASVAICFVLFGHSAGNYGSVTSPPTNLDYLQISQAIGWFTSGIATPNNETMVRYSLAAATTTPCAIQNPFNATSTVPLVAFNDTTATSSAATLTFATSSTAFATTSAFATFTIGANVQGTAVYTGTSTGQGPVVGPSQWVVIGGSGVSYGYTIGGSCTAKFISVS